MPKDNPSVGSRIFLRTVAKTLFLHLKDFGRVGYISIAFLLLPLMSLGAVAGFTNTRVQAQTPNTTLNYQARILLSSGALVPDGYYNLEFKIYDDISAGATAQGAANGGNQLWRETRDFNGGSPDRRVRVVNGYVSVSLGDVTAFPSNMPWGNNLYITMRVGGASTTPSWDTEMTNSGNRMKLSVAPVAFTANNVSSGSTNAASTNTNNITVQTGNALGTTSNSGNVSIDTGTATGTTGTITLGATNASGLTLGRTGLTTTNAGALTVTQLLTGNLGATISGATITLNASSNFNTDINTGTSTGAVTIGNGAAGAILLQSGTSIGLTGTTTVTGTLAVTNLGSTDTATFLCRNSSNILAGCNYSPLSSSLTDNIVDSLDIQEGTNNYVNINTTNGSENISFGNATTNPSYSFLGSGTLTITGDLAVNGNDITSTGDLTVTPAGGDLTIDADLAVTAGNSLSIAGGNTASRPGTPTEGMIYFDTTTKQLLTYANGKWQADRSTATKIVAASNSSQAVKDAADYVADGTGDETEINAALTAASGGKVYLTEGTFTIGASISVPNNTMLAGAGNGTIIQLADLDVSANMIVNADTTTGTGVVLQDFVLDGRDNLNTAGTQYAVLLNGMGSGTTTTTIPGATVQRLNITRIRTNAINVATSDNNKIINNNVYNSLATGIFVSTGSEFNIISGNNIRGRSMSPNAIDINGSYNTINGNNVENADYAISVTNSAIGTTASGNMLRTVNVGLRIGTSTNGSWTGNTIFTATSYGVELISTSGNTVSGNIIADSGGASANNGITFNSNADDNIIIGNRITDTSCTTTCYAINISVNTDDRNYLANNTYSGPSTTYPASIADSGTGTIYASQLTPAGVLQSISSVIKARSTSVITGSINPIASASVTGVNTKFTTDLQVGDRITVSGETRTVTVITSDTALSVDTAFSDNANDTTVDRLPASLVVKDSSNNTQLLIKDNGDTSISGTLAVGTLGSTDTATFLCRNSSNIISGCNYTPLSSSLTDNIADALDIQEGANNYFNVNTTNGSENISFGNATTNPSYNFLGSGTLSVTGNLSVSNIVSTADLTVTPAGGDVTIDADLNITAGNTLSIAGGNTASRPGSPSEGMVYYDTTTKQLLTYANGKWQADRTDAILVAASNSSQADKDAADYVATGNTGAANDGDQVEINQALTAGSGRKVVLLAGTYVVDDSIQIPNTTVLSGVGKGTLMELADLDAGEEIIRNSDTTTGTRITIQDIRIDGRDDLNTAGNQHGIYLYNIGDGGIEGARIERVSVSNLRSAGIYINSSADVTVTDSYFSGNESGVFVYDGTTKTSVTGSTFVSNEYGVYLITVDYNTVSANTFTSSGIAVNTTTSSTHNTISANTVNTATYGISVSGSSSANTVTGNTVNDTSNTGITIQSSATGNIVSGNTVTSDDTGIYLNTAGANNEVVGNRVSSTGWGIAFYDADNNSATSNTVTDSSNGIVSMLSDNVTIQNNRVHNTGGATQNQGIYINQADGTRVIGNIISDPSCSTACYAIDISDAPSDRTFVSDNIYNGQDAASSIHDLGTGTIYNTQLTTSQVLQSGSTLIQGNATSVLTGSIDPTASASVTGVSTKFTTELQPGDRITVSGETRSVVSIASDTSLTVDTAFSDNANDTSVDRLPAVLRVTTSAGANKVVVDDTGLATFYGGVTIETGDTFTINGDALTDLTGSGLTVSSNALTVDTTSATGAFINGGNAFTASSALGNTGNYDLNVMTNNLTRLTVQADGDVAFDTNTLFVDATNNRVGIGTAAPVTQLSVANTNESATLTNFTQAVDNAGINILTEWVDATYTSGLFWSSSNNNATKPKAGIWTYQDTANGTSLLLGTSNSYSTGITNTALVINPSGNVGIGDSSPAALLTVGTSDAFQVNASGDIVTSGTYNTNTFTSTSLSFAGASPNITASTTNSNLTIRANGTGVLALNTSGAGQITLGTTNSTLIGIGSSISTTNVLGATNINNNSNYNTTINAGTSTGTFSVGNSAGGAISMQSASTIGLTGTTTVTGLAAGAGTALTVNNSTSTGNIFVASDNGTPVFTIADGGNTTAIGQLLLDGTGSNQSQLIVRANSGQTVANPLVLLQNSSSAELARINATTTSLYFGNAAGGNSAAGGNNTGIGASALGSVSTGTGNTTLGSGALASVSGNNNNTAVGYNAGNLATGGNNIFLGALAGDNVTTGTDNIIIGYNLDASAAGVSNELRIGGVLQGNTSTLAAQFNGSLTIGSAAGSGSTVINNGAYRNTALALGDFAAGGSIGSAATTVDLYTYITINQTTAGQALTAPAPTTTTAGKILYISNVGTQTFSINPSGGPTITLTIGSTLSLVWNGTAWTAAGVDTGTTIVGAIDSQTKSANGAVISGNTIYLQTADGSNVGLVSITNQTLAGAKTFSSLLTGQAGLGVTGATIDLNVSSNFATNINTGTSTGAVSIGNSAAGAITLQSASSIGMTAATTITGLSTGDALTVNNSTSTGNIFVAQDNGSPVFTIGDGGIVGVGITPVTSRAMTINGVLSVANAANARLQLAPVGATTENLWNIDNTAGTLRIFREDYSATGTGANGLARLSIADSGATSGMSIDYTATNATSQRGIYNYLTVTPTSSAGSSTYDGIYSVTRGSSTTYMTSAYINGAHFFGDWNGSTGNDVYGVRGFIAEARNVSNGNVTEAIGSIARIINNSTGTISTAQGIKVLSLTNGSGTVTNNYGLYVENQTAGSSDYGIYVVGADTNALWIDSGATRLDGVTTIGTGLTSGVALTVNNATSTSNALEVQDNGTNVLVVADGGNVGIKTGSTAPTYDLSFGEGADRTIRVEARASNTTGRSLTVQAGSAGAGASAFSGGTLTLQGGDAGGTGNANGGNVVLTGGAGTGTGVRGLVVVDTATFSSATVQNFTGNASITQANIDTYGTILISSNAAGYTATLSDPTILTAGRLVYVSNIGSYDMTLSVNGGGTGNTVTLKPNTTATMIWNGSDWTAAGASSSTDLQAAYNNTATSAGGAELVLNAPGGTADGLTVRNNATTPIVGGLLEVQTSIGSNLFSVNNNATEYATNGGAETAGASASTFPASTWDTTTGGTVDRYTTAGDNVATGQASVRVQTTTTNEGARNRISTSLTSGLTYTVSFAVRGATNFSSLQVLYSPDGTTSGTTTCATGQTVTTGIWTRISCSFTASGTITSSNSILIRQTDATARTFYIDNLSINVNASATFVADGSVDSALGTNWTAFGTLDSLTRDTSVIYDTSGSVNVNTPNAADRGVRNNLAITPAVSTQYLVTFFVRSSNTFNDIRVRYTRDGGTNFVSCVDYNTQTVSTTAFTEVTCLFTTDSTTATDPDLIIDQPTGSDRNFYIDGLTMTINTNNSNNVQIGGGNKGGPATLFTLDRSNGAPIAENNTAYLGSMYYDTSTGRIQCYEADGWGACGAAPDNIVNLNPEYAGAVLNGSGVGTMTADFCSNDTALSVNSTLCSTGQAKNYYRWTSPQATQQTYSIYVTYQLPATFNGFSSDDTVQLVARADSTTNAAVTYEMYKSTGSAVTQCGTGETTVVTSSNTWQSVGINGNESTGCSFNSSSASNFIIFKINMKANSNANAYVSTLSFTTTGR